MRLFTRNIYLDASSGVRQCYIINISLLSSIYHFCYCNTTRKFKLWKLSFQFHDKQQDTVGSTSTTPSAANGGTRSIMYNPDNIITLPGINRKRYFSFEKFTLNLVSLSLHFPLKYLNIIARCSVYQCDFTGPRIYLQLVKPSFANDKLINCWQISERSVRRRLLEDNVLLILSINQVGIILVMLISR